MSGDDHVVTRIAFRMVADGRSVSAIFAQPEQLAQMLAEDKCSLGEWLRASNGDDRVVTRIEFRMIVDGRTVSATFSRPEKIADLIAETKCSLGEWLRALRDAPEVPEIQEG